MRKNVKAVVFVEDETVDRVKAGIMVREDAAKIDGFPEELIVKLTDTLAGQTDEVAGRIYLTGYLEGFVGGRAWPTPPIEAGASPPP